MWRGQGGIIKTQNGFVGLGLSKWVAAATEYGEDRVGLYKLRIDLLGWGLSKWVAAKSQTTLVRFFNWEFYDPVNTVKVKKSWSINLLIPFLDKFSPLSG